MDPSTTTPTTPTEPTWVFFAFAKGTDLMAAGFRYHNGDLTKDVQRQVVQSLRREAKKAGHHLLYIHAYPLSKKPTPNGHQRWLAGGYDVVLWEHGRGMSDVGWWA